MTFLHILPKATCDLGYPPSSQEPLLPTPGIMVRTRLRVELLMKVLTSHGIETASTGGLSGSWLGTSAFRQNLAHGHGQASVSCYPQSFIEGPGSLPAE
jgi:hypothetical protein